MEVLATSRQGLLLPFQEHLPQVDSTAFIAPTSVIVGRVKVGRGASVWYGTVVRGDVNEVEIGEESNIQDSSIIHVARHNPKGFASGTYVGRRVTVGHGAVIHAATLQDCSLVGIRAVVLDGAVVESGAMVAAGAVVRPGSVVRTGELWGGMPAKKLREVSEQEANFLEASAMHYMELGAQHRLSLGQ